MRFPQLPAIVLIVVVSYAALSQESIPAVGTPGADSPDTSSSNSSTSLPADRIIELLREKPELLIEVKKVAAERLQAQGVGVQEHSMTDDVLFGKIASDRRVGGHFDKAQAGIPVSAVGPHHHTLSCH